MIEQNILMNYYLILAHVGVAHVQDIIVRDVTVYSIYISILHKTLGINQHKNRLSDSYQYDLSYCIVIPDIFIIILSIFVNSSES